MASRYRRPRTPRRIPRRSPRRAPTCVQRPRSRGAVAPKRSTDAYSSPPRKLGRRIDLSRN
eukprot:scaffold55508_cov42-Phaeocystis_antarctica.AAC.1